MRCFGAICLPRAHLSELDLRDCKVTGATRHHAVLLTRAEVGLVNLRKADIGGAVVAGMSKLDQIELTDAKLTSPDRAALHLDGAFIRDGVYARSGCKIEGQIRAMGARVEGQFVLAGAKVTKTGGTAVNLRRAHIGNLALAGDESEGWVTASLDGAMNLSGAVIGDVGTPKDGRLPTVVAPGWKLGDVHGQIREDWRAARNWLAQTPEDKDAVQTWHELAGVYTRNGRPDLARRLNLAAANHVTRRSPLGARMGRMAYGALVGHGYAWSRAAIWLVMVVVLAAAIAHVGRAEIIPTDPKSASAAAALGTDKGAKRAKSITAAMPCADHPAYPCVNAAGYGIAVMLPASAASPAGWTATGWLAVILTVMKIVAWALSALLLAGVTGLLRKA